MTTASRTHPHVFELDDDLAAVVVVVVVGCDVVVACACVVVVAGAVVVVVVGAVVGGIVVVVGGAVVVVGAAVVDVVVSWAHAGMAINPIATGTAASANTPATAVLRSFGSMRAAYGGRVG
ncbi:MAG TPA: hypothetical protein VMF35_09730 [Acidimicrobiales bacterium]|nr:hypothetical protein [Acidimicrobiales bacterium]